MLCASSLSSTLRLSYPALPRSPGVLLVTFSRQPRLVPWNPHEFSYGPLSPSEPPSLLSGGKNSASPSARDDRPTQPSSHDTVSSGQDLPTALFPQLHTHTSGSPEACPVYGQLSPASLDMQFLFMELMLGEDPVWEEHPSLFHFGGHSALSFPPARAGSLWFWALASSVQCCPPSPTM